MLLLIIQLSTLLGQVGSLLALPFPDLPPLTIPTAITTTLVAWIARIAGIVGVFTLVFSLAGQVGQTPDWKKIAFEVGGTVLLLWFVIKSYDIFAWVLTQFGITIG